MYLRQSASHSAKIVKKHFWYQIEVHIKGKKKDNQPEKNQNVKSQKIYLIHPTKICLMEVAGNRPTPALNVWM